MTSQLIQRAVETLEKMKKGGSWDYESNREQMSYDEAISDIQTLLPQIITGVIEEIEKMVEKKKITKKKGVMEVLFGDGKKERVRAHTNMDVGYNMALNEVLASLKEVVKE